MARLRIAEEEVRVYEARIVDTLALLSELSAILAAKNRECETLRAQHHEEVGRRVKAQPREGSRFVEMST